PFGSGYGVGHPLCQKFCSRAMLRCTMRRVAAYYTSPHHCQGPRHIKKADQPCEERMPGSETPLSAPWPHCRNRSPQHSIRGGYRECSAAGGTFSCLPVGPSSFFATSQRLSEATVLGYQTGSRDKPAAARSEQD